MNQTRHIICRGQTEKRNKRRDGGAGGDKRLGAALHTTASRPGRTWWWWRGAGGDNYAISWRNGGIDDWRTAIRLASSTSCASGITGMAGDLYTFFIVAMAKQQAYGHGAALHGPSAWRKDGEKDAAAGRRGGLAACQTLQAGATARRWTSAVHYLLPGSDVVAGQGHSRRLPGGGQGGRKYTLPGPGTRRAVCTSSGRQAGRVLRQASEQGRRTCPT